MLSLEQHFWGKRFLKSRQRCSFIYHHLALFSFGPSSSSVECPDLLSEIRTQHKQLSKQQKLSTSMASSSSSSPFDPTVSSHPWKYNVFLSFRGEDTRKTFVDHLYSALVQQGIHTYKDDETLPRGESIGPSLEKAIEESQIVVIIFSKNYADSSWCLSELAYIMKCKDTRGKIVIPVFYGMEASTMRKQKYGEAFSKHELENKDKVESWRQALTDASNLSGWETKHMANGHESKAIKEIVDTISRRLHPLISTADGKLIGIDSRVHDLKSKLEIGSGGVRMIGIWGVGGGGKTTLALSVYEEISRKFDGCCFMENIREESSKYGLNNLQEKVLSNILKQKGVEVNKVGGRWLPDDRLRRIKLLIILDDVDHLDHLRMLVGSHGWFGEGSRIIITTRDKHLLTAHKVDVIYNITLLNDDGAIKLLQKHAPRDYKPMDDYELLCQDVVSYAGGLPLALTVLGCFLCDKDNNEWRSTLVRLKEIPETDIVVKLKISYDGLKLVEKELFLDIACFFRGMHKNERTMVMFDACGFHPVIGVRVLIQKALITISEYGRFEMHDLVQEMGHYIVRGKHPNNPEKHSRVWKKEDVLKVYTMDAVKELDMIEAIRFECNESDAIELLPPIVAKMKNLRWFDQRGDLANPFPTNFSPVELRCLRLSGISRKQLWTGYKHLSNLKIMELVDLKNLLTTPDFDGLPNLERFSLYGCRRLKKIHPSIGRLQKLVFLSIEECPSLKMFPPITQLKKLHSLSFAYCPIDVEKCSLEDPCLLDHTRIRFFPTCLRKLDLSGCKVGDNDIDYVVWELPNLEVLILTGNNFTRLNFSVLRVPRLKMLILTGCKDLVELSELPSGIAVVVADYCDSLESFGDISNCKWLWKVSVLRGNELGPHGGNILLDSMLQGNALEDHFMSVGFENQMIPKGFVGRMYKGKTFTIRLPDDWYNHFCGFLICVVTEIECPFINIVINQEPDEDSPSELWQESIEALKSKYHKTRKYVGYVSFSSLRLLNSSYKSISFSIKLDDDDDDDDADDDYYDDDDENCVGVELVPRKSKVDEIQTTECSEFWDMEGGDGATFRIQHDPQSCIKILWRPQYYGIEFPVAPRRMTTFSYVPPGFRHHPTKRELVNYYLIKR